MRAAVQRWAIERVLYGARAALSRARTAEAVRALVPRAAPFVARKENYDASESVAMGNARGRWRIPGSSPRRAVAEPRA